jgi:hypothetical protein
VLHRVVSAPLWLHAVTLAIVLLAVLAVTVPGHAYFSDEGAAIIQERQLRAGDGWIYNYPFAVADPTGELRPFINAEQAQDGVAPYARHPLFVGVLALADAALGVPGMVLVAVVGSTFAALGAGLLGRRIDPRLGIPALWVAGLASPLFFDAYLILAHTLAAATAAFAVLGALIILERKDSSAWTYLLLASATAATVLLRGEGVVLVPGIVAGAVLIARLEPDRRNRAVQIALVVGVVGVVAFVAERAYIVGIVGDANQSSRVVTENWIVGRFTGLFRTWFPTTSSYATVMDTLVMLVPVIVAAAAIRVRRTSDGGPLVIGFSAVAGLFLLRLIFADSAPIPGLAVAFPLGWAGLWLLKRRHFTNTTMRFVGTAGLVMVVAIVLTQYSQGAGVEWGGRYFAITLPIITPVLLSPYLHIDWDTTSIRRALPIAATTLTIVLIAIAVQTLRETHTLHREAAEHINAAATAHPPPEGDPSVVVITGRLGPQFVWTIFGDHDWLAPAPHNLDAARVVLDGTGHVQAVVVDSNNLGTPDWADWTVQRATHVHRELPVYSLARR